jgi:hypothetical protein
MDQVLWYDGAVQKKDHHAVTIRLATRLWDAITDYRFEERIETRTEAIERLLEYALKHRPPKRKETRQTKTPT